MSKKKTVAIIGAGASGLTAIKSCLDEGLEPVCFEMWRDIGGLWNYTEETDDLRASVMKSTIINTSKEMMTFSDFPVPAEFANFMHNTTLLKYFRQYAQEFNLMDYIRFNIKVLSVQKDENFSDNGRWVIAIENTKTKHQDKLTFDAVMICTGHHASPYKPAFQGLDKFKGHVMHSHDYKSAAGFEDKRVLIIGIGNSGGDAAVELGRSCVQTYLSTRRGCWVLNRVYDAGIPVDLAIGNRFSTVIGTVFPNLANWFGEGKANARFDHEKYGLKPNHRLLSQHPMVNDDLPNRILSGTVIIKPDVKKFTEDSVVFEDGTSAEIDVILMCTGYTFGFPFLDSSIVNVHENKVELYQYVFPPKLEKPTLAVIGCIQPLGAVNPISEMQSRWATRVFNGKSKLPTASEMMSSIRAKEKAMEERYFKTQRHTIQVDWIPYMDELAEHVGCKPNLLTTFLTDPGFAFRLLFGPCAPYQYRLCGPGKWEGAKEALETVWARVYAPLSTRKVNSDVHNIAFFKKWLLFFFICAFLFFYYYSF